MRRLGLVATALVSALAVAGCGGDADSDGGDAGGSGSSTTPTTGSTDYVPVPEGVTLTPQGSDLELGDPAVVGWNPAVDKVGVIELQVIAFEKVDIESLAAWDLDDAGKDSTPYFVRAAVQNVGDSNLTGVRVPLYLADGVDTLIPASTFDSLFTPCPSRPLPKPFKPGDSTTTCLVYLLGRGGDFQGVRFYPGSGFDPISWSGEVTEPKVEKPDKKDKNKKQKPKNGDQQDTQD